MPVMDKIRSRREFFEPLREFLEPASEPKHFGSRILLDLWRAREADGGFAVGTDVPSRPIARIMHNLVLFEPVVESGRVTDLRVRVAGDSLFMRFGRDTTGMMLSQLFGPEEFESHLERSNQIIRNNAPMLLRSELRRGSLVEHRLEIAVLPVWNAQHTERWVLAGVFYFN